MPPEPIEVFPPPWFMDGLNRMRFSEGQPTLSMFDPVALALWHFASQPVFKPAFLLLACN